MSSGEQAHSGRRQSPTQNVRFANIYRILEVPSLAALCVFGRLYGTGAKVWIALPAWLVAHTGLGFDHAVKLVTATVTIVAIGGALLQWVNPAWDAQQKPAADGLGRQRVRFWLRRLSLLATCMPIAILFPVPGALAYLAGSVLIVSLGSWMQPRLRALPLASARRRWLRSSFPLLSALCFAVFAWQYQPDRLTRALLVAAGVSLILRAFAAEPTRPPAQSSSAESRVA